MRKDKTYIERTVNADVYIGIDDVKEFIDNCDQEEINSIVNYCKRQNSIPVLTLQDEYKVKALKEIWDDLSIEGVEKMVYQYKHHGNT